MKSSIYSTQYQIIRKWFTHRRLELKLTLREVGDKAGRHHSIFGKIESDRKIDIVEYVEYCQLLDLDPHEGIDMIVDSMNIASINKHQK
jgi:hypothetical protein